MNFLLRQSSGAAADPPALPRSSSTTLEGLIAEDSSSPLGYSSDSFDNSPSTISPTTSDTFTPLPDKHIDIKDDEGWIAIPFKEIPEDWGGAPDMNWFSSFDRPFVFLGEQVHVLACLSISKQDTEIITPFKVAAVMNKNGAKYQSGNMVQQVEVDGDIDAKSQTNHPEDISASEYFLRMEDHRKQTQTLLQKFKNSHFFVRISEPGEQLWTKKNPAEFTDLAVDMESMNNDKSAGSGTSINAEIDNGRFDARVSGGLARNSIKCCSLANGDIVVHLQVNVGVDPMKDPILEILQFERHRDKIMTLESDASNNLERSPCGELVKWLLPLDNSHSPVSRPLPSSIPSPLVNSSHKASFSASTGSQLFSFGHFRSYSMSSLPQNSAPAPAPAPSSPTSTSASKPTFDLEDWDRFASQKSPNSTKSGSHDLQSFRGIPLEPERFSVCCGLEGIYIPGRRWKRQIEIIQPIDIHTFAADCNADDLLCVQIKNVSPPHVPDIVVYIDAITIVLEEASKVGPPLSVPTASIEAGNNYTLPNLALRRGEEHSFILKPAISALKKSTFHRDETSQLSRSKARGTPASIQLPPRATEGKKSIPSVNKYAVLVSCHCNYSESRLFFKKPTNWRPRISRDLMISVASEMAKQSVDLTCRISQLPVQVLTLQASNLTSENLTLTVLAPASFTPPPSVLSQNSALASPVGPFVGVPLTERLSSLPILAENQKESASSDEQTVTIADAIPSTALTCTHLWLHSRAPLGCVPSQSTATIKLGLLPLTDGIITLDTLQIYVKEKGINYIPEHTLKINAISSISPGMI